MNKLTQFLLSLACIVVLIIGVSSILKEDDLGGRYIDTNQYTLAGTSSNLKSLPNYAVFANNTTTGDYVEDGDALVLQRLLTRGKRDVVLSIKAVAPTATSTMYIRQMGSFNGTDYFDIASSTPAVDIQNATTTMAAAPVRAFQWDPGVATSSISTSFSTYGYEYTRFVMWSEGWSVVGGDDTGVQVWIEATVIEDTNY